MSNRNPKTPTLAEVEAGAERLATEGGHPVVIVRQDNRMECPSCGCVAEWPPGPMCECLAPHRILRPQLKRGQPDAD